MSSENKLKTIRHKIDKTDRKMVRLFEKRMDLVKSVAEYKKENKIAVTDKGREEKMFSQNCRLIDNKDYVPYYKQFLKSTVEISKRYQKETNGIIFCGETEIVIRKGALKSFDKYFEHKSKALIITDDGVPYDYISLIKSKLPAEVLVLPQGEISKNFDNFQKILDTLCKNEFDRNDAIIAVGGGMVCDIAGFAAANYMRGIPLYLVPTTLLSQVDAAIGGKCGVDFCGYKNSIGAFYFPKRVIIDTDTLLTLDKRQISCGLAECVKMAVTCDSRLFETIESGEISQNIDSIVYRCVKIKSDIVNSDLKEKNVRRVLNFGHTLGHAIESADGFTKLLHGECVAIGMLPMCSDKIRQRVKNVLLSLNLPVSFDCSNDKIYYACLHDKKRCGDIIKAVFSDEIGSYYFKEIKVKELKSLIEKM